MEPIHYQAGSKNRRQDDAAYRVRPHHQVRVYVADMAVTKMTKAKKRTKKASKDIINRRGGRKQSKWANIGVAGGDRQKDVLVDW